MNEKQRIPTARIDLKTDYNTRHPWIFAKMVNRPRAHLAPGSLVDVYSRGGSLIGRGMYHPGRTVAVRLLTKNPKEKIDAAFVFRRLEEAKRLREDILDIPAKSDGYRLVHGEADGFPGLVIDKFGPVIVVEPFSAGYLALAGFLAEALEKLYPACRVCFRPDEKTEKNEGVSFAELAKKYPAPPSADFTENGLALRVDFSAGHKTGYFLDQRDNRAEVARLARGKEVFDLFCYTGGFGLNAAKAGAKRVVSVDLDEKAIAVAKENARRNGLEIEYEHRNCFDFLRDRGAQGENADLVIVDPAKLAGVRDELPRALKTYDDINRLALGCVRPGGILVSCSCSGLVSEQQFLSVLANAAGEARVELQIFKVTGAAPDHPVRTDFPEGRYLKAVFARVVKP